jgi:site-specific recombinase XerD
VLIKMALCSGIKLFEDGERLFLTTQERRQFRKAMDSLSVPQRLFCRLLYYTGCKVGEATTFFPHQVRNGDGTILLGNTGEKLSERSIPVPPALIMEFSIHFSTSKMMVNRPLWSMSRSKGWRIVNEAMNQAGIFGKHATPTGLRHSFAISCLEMWPKISFSQIQGWLGHRSLDLTLSYFKAFALADEIDGNLEDLWSYF